MKTVILKRIRLLNFKGVRDLHVEFGAAETVVSGCNGSGKTTLFDAFTWVLFGKDSKGRKDFRIKTLSPDGEAVAKLPHEVEAVLEVDGEEVVLLRRFNEKWVKRRGSAVEEFSGHEEERLWNGVPCSVREYQNKVSGVCDENVFRMITAPAFFPNCKPDVQRAILVRIAGEVSDEEVAEGNPEFASLLKRLSGKDWSEYKRELAAKKRRLNAEAVGIPERISERLREMPEPLDYEALERELAAKEAELEEVEKILSDAGAAGEAKRKEMGEAVSKLYDLKIVVKDLEAEAEAAERAELKKAAEIHTAVEELSRSRDRWEKELEAARSDIAALKAKRAALLAEWRGISAEGVSFRDGDFVCPTCGRALDLDGVKRRKLEIEAAFNKDKSERLSANVRKGNQVKSEMEYLTQRCGELEFTLSEVSKEISEFEGKLSENPAPHSGGGWRAKLESDEGYIKALRDVVEQERILELMCESPMDLSAERSRKETLDLEVSSLKERLAGKERLERNKERISELESQLSAISEEVAGLEREEFSIQSFSKAKMEALESNINGLFEHVRFKLWERQINGGEVETCEAVVGGVPYSSLNSAMKVNAGLEIINAICLYEGVHAPIFIDNAESVSELCETSSQVIRLMVDAAYPDLWITKRDF